MTGYGCPAAGSLSVMGRLWWFLGLLGLCAGTCCAGAAGLVGGTNAGLAEVSRLLEAAGTVEVRSGAEGAWEVAEAGREVRVGDRVRTGVASRAAVQLSDRSVIRLGERTVLEVQAPRGGERRRFGLVEGLLFLFNRERPADVEFETPLATGAIRGTEFVLAADPGTGATRLALLDGRVEITSAASTVVAEGGEEVRVEPGGMPVKSPLLEAVGEVQWALYYPAVVDPEELPFGVDERAMLSVALAAYRAGDLAGALVAAEGTEGGGPSAGVFRAALDLTVGRVAVGERRLAGLAGVGEAEARVVLALREIIAVVRGVAVDGIDREPVGASGWLARSYALQGRFRLEEALQAARRAVGLSPAFGFAWTRLAELLLSVGRRGEALEALGRALELSPRLAHARVLEGFARMDGGSLGEALGAFDRAIALDAAMGLAWLGRGLALMRLGNDREAMVALQAAVALDPRRALARSYLAKAFSEAGDEALAGKEFRLAKGMDPGDPTPWFYSALDAWRANRPNQAVSDLGRSVELNENLRLFRSRLRLDRDLAVRSANLAAIYRDAGLPEAGLRSAARAVHEDYSNFSGHLFLAQSFRALEDPDRFDLRYETARESELLVANLLAPPEGANLSRLVSQQEHLQFFDPRPFGASSWTSYRSTGEWRQKASFFGATGGFGYALDASLDSRPGEGAAEGRDRRDISLQLKQRVGVRDELLLSVGLSDSEAGDVARRRDPSEARAGFRVDEEQVPNVHLGWHREWAAGSHTLVLFARLTDDLSLVDPRPDVLFLRRPAGNAASAERVPFFDLSYASEVTVYSAEVQHLWQVGDHTWVAGIRGQFGEVASEAVLSRPLTGVVTDDTVAGDIRRANGYVLHQWRVARSLRWVGGIGYDRLEHPLNTEVAPLAAGSVDRDLVAPRAGLLYDPWADGLFRAAYSRSLGGVYFDQSVRLEPAQVAGFNQAFRSLVPESVSGLVPGTRFETLSVGFDQSFRRRTFLGVEAELLRSEGDRTVGALTHSLPVPVPDTRASVVQALDFEERSLGMYLVHLVGDGLAVGLRYRVSEARLGERYPGLAMAGPGGGGGDMVSVLQRAAVSVDYQHSSGVFVHGESAWCRQDNSGYEPAIGHDPFWRHDVWVGYRWPRRRAELRVGCLNVGDADPRLHPLNLLPAMPRERTAVISLRLNY